MTDEIDTFDSLNYKKVVMPGIGITYQDENDCLHRDNDKPAVIYEDGTMVWFKHGLIHRETGPAIIPHSGPKYWYINGEFIKTTDD